MASITIPLTVPRDPFDQAWSNRLRHESRDFMLRVRLTPSEHAQLEQAAQSDGVSMSAYVRSKLFGGT